MKIVVIVAWLATMALVGSIGYKMQKGYLNDWKEAEKNEKKRKSVK